MPGFGQDTQDIGPQVALRDVALPLVTLRDNVTSDDTIITDHKSANMPTLSGVAAVSALGRLRYLLRFFGTAAANKDCMVYIQMWPKVAGNGVRAIGRRAMKVQVTLGAMTTAAHPVTQVAGTTYYEADGFTNQVATVPYEFHKMADGSGSCIILDMTGHDKLSVQVDLDGGGDALTSLTVIGRPL